MSKINMMDMMIFIRTMMVETSMTDMQILMMDLMAESTWSPR